MFDSSKLHISRLITALLGTALFVLPPGALAALVTLDANQDAYVFSIQPNNTQGVGVAVKADVNNYSRKTWISFDISALGLHNAGMSLDSASFSLIKSDNGQYSNKTLLFSVYGLTEETIDNWSENTLTWNNAPGNNATVSGVNSSITGLLGQFSFVDNSSAVDRKFSIGGQPLIDFLNADTDGRITMIITRSTYDGVTNGFYSPTLSVSVSQVPLPASIWLFLSGLGTLVVRFRKHIAG